MKRITITSPFIKNILPFQRPIYDIAKDMGFCCEELVDVPRWSHFFLFNFPINFSIPFLLKKKVARLQFVSGTHPEPMIFPYAYRNEIIPIIWDCWPDFVSRMVRIFKRCEIKVAFFTSKQTAEFFSRIFPQKKIFFLPEAINTALYKQGPSLERRSVDVLEYGRLYADTHEQLLKIRNIRHLYAEEGKKMFDSFDDLAKQIADAKVVVCYPRSVTHPNIAKGIETLTQRYWECMYSGTVIVGRAPQELIELLGYNPVIDAAPNDIKEIVENVLKNIPNYQMLCDRNRDAARKYGDWKSRFDYVEQTLDSLGYTMR